MTRDIRDGVQRRLVSVLIDLWRAEQCLDTEPDRARELIREALGQANVEPDELRDLTIGIHPGVLGARGLAAAVSGLAQASPIPLTMDVSPARFAHAVETVAYLLIAETLAKAGGDAEVTRVHVAAYRSGPDLIVEVCDDGPGGADRYGRGVLAGLRARVVALGGTMRVLSQVGIGTRIRASLPHADRAVT